MTRRELLALLSRGAAVTAAGVILPVAVLVEPRRKIWQVGASIGGLVRIAVPTRRGGSQLVASAWKGAIWAATRHADAQDDPATAPDDGFGVTHVETGLACRARWVSRETAIEIAQAFDQLGDPAPGLGFAPSIEARKAIPDEVRARFVGTADRLILGDA